MLDGRRDTRRIVLGCALFLGFLLANAAAVSAVSEAPQPSLKLKWERSDPREKRLAVYVVARAPIGAYTLDLEFDPTSVALARIEGGRTAAFASPPAADETRYASGKVRFSAFQTASLDGPKGRVHLATLVFQPVGGARRTRARLSLRGVTVADTAGVPLDVREMSRETNFVFRSR